MIKWYKNVHIVAFLNKTKQINIIETAPQIEQADDGCQRGGGTGIKKKKNKTTAKVFQV